MKIKIMQFLLKNEMERVSKPCINLIAQTPFPEDLLIDPDIDSFDVFRCYVFRLLDKSNDSTILKFIKDHPSVYDPVADIFAHDSSPG